MGIVSSVIFDDHVQADGTRQIIEKHTDHVGVEYLIKLVERSLAYDAVAAMNARVASLNESLARGEDEAAYSRIVAGEDILTVVNSPVYSTAKRLAKKIIYFLMRSRNSDENLVRLIVLVEPLLAYLEANYNPSQLASFLDITLGQLTKMNNKRIALLAAAADVTTAETYNEEIE